MRAFFYLLAAINITLISCSQNPGNPTAENKTQIKKESSSQPSEGELLFDNKCNVCHIKTKPTPKEIKTLSAPPISCVARQIKKDFSDKDIEDAKTFILNYVFFPDITKAHCDTLRLKSFGAMPSLKGSVTEDELDLIADYILENYPLTEKEKP